MPKHNFSLLMRSLGLPQFNTIEDLSVLTGLSGSLLYCLSQKQERYYHEFAIPKRNGSSRTINAPSYSMHIVQRWILANILDKVSPSKYAMAFRKGQAYGCKANAVRHVGTLYGVSFDLKDFFPSIESNRIYNVFSNIGYESLPATILTNLCTLDGCLPQGGACSPALSNFVCLSLDSRLGGLCEKRRIRFSRYADDMYFSSDSQDTLKKSVPIIRKIISDEGFLVNEEKVHYYTPSNRKAITGITIVQGEDIELESRLRARKTLKKQIRAAIFSAVFTGDYVQKEKILGEIAYVNYIEPGYKEKIKKYLYATAQKIDIFPELVALYNSNLFYTDMTPIESRSLDSLVQDYAEDDFFEFNMFLDAVRTNREDYLSKQKVRDICKYESWPGPCSTSENICDEDDPF